MTVRRRHDAARFHVVSIILVAAYRYHTVQYKYVYIDSTRAYVWSVWYWDPFLTIVLEYYIALHRREIRSPDSYGHAPSPRYQVPGTRYNSTTVLQYLYEYWLANFARVTINGIQHPTRQSLYYTYIYLFCACPIWCVYNSNLLRTAVFGWMVSLYLCS